jgi:hypothetical protein
LQRDNRIGKCLFLAALSLALAGFAAAPSWAQKAAPFDVYAVRVHLDETAASAISARDAARGEGQRHAYILMLSRLTRANDASRLPPPNDAALNDLIQGFEVANERRSSVRYIADFTYHFRPDGIRAVLRQAQIPFAEAVSRPLVVLPVLENGTAPALWDSNPWRAAWNQAAFPPGLVPLIEPTGDATDAASIDAPAADRGDDTSMGNIAKRYGGADVLVVRATIKPGASENVTVSATRYAPGSGSPGMSWSGSYTAASGEAEPDLLARAALGIDAQIEEAWKEANVIDFSQAGMLAVTVPVADLQSWAALNAQLAGIPVIQHADLLALNRQSAQLLIHYVGGLTQLRLALAQNNLDLGGDPANPVLSIHGAAASSP